MVSLIGIALLFSGLLMFLSKIGTLFGWLSLLAAVIGFVIFYKRATTAEQPLVRLTILKNPAFVLFLCGFLVCQFLLLGISFVLPNFVQIVLEKCVCSWASHAARCYSRGHFGTTFWTSVGSIRR